MLYDRLLDTEVAYKGGHPSGQSTTLGQADKENVVSLAELTKCGNLCGLPPFEVVSRDGWTASGPIILVSLRDISCASLEIYYMSVDSQVSLGYHFFGLFLRLTLLEREVPCDNPSLFSVPARILNLFYRRLTNLTNLNLYTR